jgi:peptide/nickel transport system substrate-binding protein
MHRRQWLAAMMIVAGASLLIAASFASASTSSKALKKGGIWRFGNVGASVQVDPQLAYVTTAWSLEYSTAAKLYNYPDKKGPAGSKLIPEVASKFTVSKNGRVYTFTIRPGFVFSDGTKVTAKTRSSVRRTTTWLRRARRSSPTRAARTSWARRRSTTARRRTSAASSPRATS